MVSHRHLMVVYCFDKETSYKKRLLEKLKHDIDANSDHVLYCGIQAKLEQDQLMCRITKDKIWSPISQTCVENLLTDDEYKEESEVISLAERLHETADSLPFTGSLLDVIIELTDDIIECDSHLTLWGALRRLRDWHNAAITIVLQNDTNFKGDFNESLFSVKKLQLFLGANIVNCVEEVKFDRQVDWRGKVSVVDKTVNKGFILPGFELKTDKERNGQGSSFTYPSQQTQQNMDNTAILGRMLEVLDEVDVRSVASFMFTSHTSFLSLYQQHPHSKSFIDHISCGDGTGVLMRLTCYPQTSDMLLCGDKYLSTSSWKESVMADITYVQEPEEESMDKCEFLYFLVTNTLSGNHNDYMVVHQLRSPGELDGSVIYHLYHHSILPCNDDCSDRDIVTILSELPEFCDVVLQKVNKDLQEIQMKLLQEWLEKQDGQGKRTIVKASDIYTFLAEVQQIFLDNVMKHLWKSQLDTDTMQMPKRQGDLDMNPSEWPERKYLVYQESQKRALSRLQSTESMALSSPIQPSETKKMIDVQDFLKLFKTDGTATAENLSPVRKRHPSRSQAWVIDQDQEDVVMSSWPDSFDLCRYPDIYYNKGKKREKFEIHFNKLRDRYVTAETYSSCSSPKVVFPNKPKSNQSSNKPMSKKKNPGLLSPRRSPRKSLSKATMLSPRRSPRKSVGKATILSPRRSPRKKVSKQFQTGDMTVARRDMRLSDSAQLPVPKHLLPDSDGKRRHSLSSVPTDKCKSLTEHNKSDSRRMPGSAVQNDGKRRNSLEGSDLDNSLSKRVSRSERHKRKLEEICSNVLLSKGVDKDSPIYSSCASRLYKVTKLYVMDLPTSRNLKDEMKNIATNQVQHVIDVETRRQNTVSDGGGGQSKRQRRT